MPFRFPLLRAQTLKRLDDAREFFLKRDRCVRHALAPGALPCSSIRSLFGYKHHLPRWLEKQA